jgi:hypothetical protein
MQPSEALYILFKLCGDVRHLVCTVGWGASAFVVAERLHNARKKQRGKDERKGSPCVTVGEAVGKKRAIPFQGAPGKK